MDVTSETPNAAPPDYRRRAEQILSFIKRLDPDQVRTWHALLRMYCQRHEPRRRSKGRREQLDADIATLEQLCLEEEQ